MHCGASSCGVARELVGRAYPQAPSASGTLESDSDTFVSLGPEGDSEFKEVFRIIDFVSGFKVRM